jgi:hypothetical protein
MGAHNPNIHNPNIQIPNIQNPKILKRTRVSTTMKAIDRRIGTKHSKVFTQKSEK